MSFIAAAILGAGAIGAGASIYGSYEQSQAEGQAANTLLQGQNSALSQIQNFLSPYSGIASSVLPTLTSLLTPGANQTTALNQLPGYQFIQNWGQQGVTNQATMRGLGGNILAAGAQYATGTAQQAFGSLVNPLLQLLQTGASAAGTGATSSANVLTGTASQVAGTQVGAANALAGGATGAANALSGATGGLTNLALLSKLTGNTGMYSNPTAYNSSPYANQTGPMDSSGLVYP